MVSVAPISTAGSGWYARQCLLNVRTPMARVRLLSCGCRGGQEAPMAPEYKVAQLTPEEGPWLTQVQRMLDDHARDGWHLVTAFQYQGAAPQPGDTMVQSLSHV